MQETKTAVIVLSVLLLVATIMLYVNNKRKKTLSFNACTVPINNIMKGLEADEYSAAKNKLALCLCNVYTKKPDTAVANQITAIYKQFGTHSKHDSVIYIRNIDSLIKNKSVVFDTLILID